LLKLANTIRVATMNKMHKYAAIIFLALTCSAAACVKNEEVLGSTYYVVNSNGGNAFGIPTNATYRYIISAFEVVEAGEELLEGDLYNFAIVRIADGLDVKVSFDGALSNGSSRVAYFETRSAMVRDHYGLGVGSDLGRVMEAWPDGHLFTGYSDAGRVARYSTGTEIIFLFDVTDIDENCFLEYEQYCDVSRSIAVMGIAFYPILRSDD
jgi:hypothetical protein